MCEAVKCKGGGGEAVECKGGGEAVECKGGG